MSYQQFRRYIKTLQQQFAALKMQQIAADWEETIIAIEELQLIFEEMQTSVDAAAVIEEKLEQQNQQITASYQKYYELFLYSPLAYLVTDINGLILEANQAIAQLLNVPQPYLIGKPLANYVVLSERRAFRNYISQLSYTTEVIKKQVILSARGRKLFVAQLHGASISNKFGSLKTLQIGVLDISEYQQITPQPVEESKKENIPAQVTTSIPSLPLALDGLQVLVVDDEVDAREFITAVLESYGICVTAVGSAAAALKALETFHPDVLVSDIRMPNEDGYSLIRQVRELEAQKGWHIPSAAITAYLEEDREKAIRAGFEAHLHKLAQPTQLVEMVAQLARRAQGN